jgi:hypothetical protein
MVANELWLALLLGPFFLFPRREWVVVFAVVPLLWMLRWWVRGHLTRRTPFDWPILLIMLSWSLPM